MILVIKLVEIMFQALIASVPSSEFGLKNQNMSNEASNLFLIRPLK